MKNVKKPEKAAKRTIKWKYKDANRYWWTVVAVEGKRIDESYLYPGYYHTEWGVTVKRDSDLIYEDVLCSQYDEPLPLDEVLLAWLTYCNSVCIGMNKHAKAEK